MKDELRVIPGVGVKFAKALRALGINHVSDLKGADPQELYDRLQVIQGGGYLDRCVLYEFRCAVYYAENDVHDPELLKWWRWKGRE